MPQQNNKYTEKLQLIGFSTFNLPSISHFPHMLEDSLKFITTEKNISTASKDYLDHDKSRFDNQYEQDSLALRIEIPQQLTFSAKKKKLGCTCKKTFCLKMYCECFANNKTCGQDCACCDCKNISGNNEVIQEAKGNVKQKGLHNCCIEEKRCNCKKSFCQKKYCECFNAGISCSDACKCLDCSNKDIERSYKDISKIQKKQTEHNQVNLLDQQMLADLQHLQNM